MLSKSYVPEKPTVPYEAENAVLFYNTEKFLKWHKNYKNAIKFILNNVVFIFFRRHKISL